MAAFVLIAAALGKVFSLLQPNSDLQNSIVQAIGISVLIVFESMLACWLISRMAERAARLTAIMTFLVFAIVALNKWFDGTHDCGCFGSVSTPPWIAFTIDLVLLTAFCVAWGESSGSRLVSGRQVAGVTCVHLVLFVYLIGYSVNLHEGQSATAIRVRWAFIPKDSTPDVIYAIRDHEDLVQDDAVLLFYRPGCSKCDDQIARLEQLADKHVGKRFALVSVTSSTGTTQIGGVPVYEIEDYRKSGIQWAIDTPSIVTLDHGRFTGHFQTVDDSLDAIQKRRGAN